MGNFWTVLWTTYAIEAAIVFGGWAWLRHRDRRKATDG